MNIVHFNWHLHHSKKNYVKFRYIQCPYHHQSRSILLLIDHFYLYAGWKSAVSGSFNQIQGERCWKNEWRERKLLKVCTNWWMSLVMLNSGFGVCISPIKPNDRGLVSIGSNILHVLCIYGYFPFYSMTSVWHSSSMVFRGQSNPQTFGYLQIGRINNNKSNSHQNERWNAPDTKIPRIQNCHIQINIHS